MVELDLGLEPTMPLFFRLGRSVFPGWEKRTFVTRFGVRNNGRLMLVCSNVHITKEFSIFGVTFDATIWDSLEA